MRAKKQKKQLSRGAARTLVATTYGIEPLIKTGSRIELISAYNWYNSVLDSSEAVQFVVDYAVQEKFDKASIAAIRKIKPYDLRTIGWTYRMSMNGGEIDKGVIDRITTKLKTLIGSVKADAPVTAPVSYKKPFNPADELIADIDVILDSLWENDSMPADAASLMKDRNLSVAAQTKIRAYYSRIANELYEVLNSGPADLKQAYKPYKTKTIRTVFEFVQGLIATTNAEKEVKQKTRKPRRKKVKTPEQLAKAVKYLPSYEPLKLTSIDPPKIVGATQVWLFDTKYRKLSVINASVASGLSIKGTTIINFDEKTSITKTLRKPELVLKDLLEGGKITVRKLMDTINTKAVPATGRINSDIVIVKVSKG